MGKSLITLKFSRAYSFYKKHGMKTTIRKKFLDRAVDFYYAKKLTVNPRVITKALSNIEIDRPIWLLGVQGGGGTLTSRIIKRHQGIVGPCSGAKNWVKTHEMHNARALKFLNNDFTLRCPGYKNMRGDEESHPVFGLERSFLYAINDFLPEYRRTEKDFNKESAVQLQNTIKKCIRAYALNLNTARFHDMSQTYSLKVPLLNRIFPDSKFIVLIRDPFAICWRQAHKMMENKLWLQPPDFKFALKCAVEHYKNTYEICLKDLRQLNNFIAVRYEDVTCEMEKTMKTIFDYSELEFSTSYLPGPDDKCPLGTADLRKWYPVRKDINKKYREEITVEAVDYIEENLKDLITEFNYERPK